MYMCVYRWIVYRVHACQLLAPTLTVNAYRVEGLVSCMRMNSPLIFISIYTSAKQWVRVAASSGLLTVYRPTVVIAR